MDSRGSARAFTGYLGQDRSSWTQWDACELAQNTTFRGPILVDQGDADPFLETQLKPEQLQSAFDQAGMSLQLRMQRGYDHSYYFIASFIGAHLRHHAQLLSTWVLTCTTASTKSSYEQTPAGLLGRRRFYLDRGILFFLTGCTGQVALR